MINVSTKVIIAFERIGHALFQGHKIVYRKKAYIALQTRASHIQVLERGSRPVWTIK